MQNQAARDSMEGLDDKVGDFMRNYVLPVIDEEHTQALEASEGEQGEGESHPDVSALFGASVAKWRPMMHCFIEGLDQMV